MEPDLIIVRTVLVCMGNYVGQSDHENTAGCTAVQQSTVVQPAVSGQTHLLSLLPLTPADLHQASTDYL